MNKKKYPKSKSNYAGQLRDHPHLWLLCRRRKNKKTQLKEAFLSLPEEEIFKYFELFRKTLSGTIGKNLLNMEFPLSAENAGGTQDFLLKLRASQLTNDALLDAFYDRIIDLTTMARTT